MLRGPTAAVVALALATTIGAVVHAYSGSSGDAPYTRPPPPPPVGVFRDGGVPRHDPTIEHALAIELPQLIADLERGGTDDATRTAWFARMRASAAFTTQPPPIASAWRTMIADLEIWWRHSSSRDGTEAAHALRARIQVLSDQLAAAGLGYYVDADLDAAGDRGHDRTGIHTYRIDNVAFVRTNDHRIRVLDARRLDRADAATVLGRSDHEIDDPIVVLDAVEAKIAAQILPVLAGAAFPIGDDGWANSSIGRATARAAGNAIRRELFAALYDDVRSTDAAAAACTKLLVESVRRHEAQHRRDRDRDLPHPDALATRISDDRNSSFALRARYELSAYLSQIASDVWLPQLTLWNLARHGFRRSHDRAAEALVATLVVETLARRLGVDGAGPVLRNGEIDRDRLATLLVGLGERTTAELRGGAAAVWRDLYKEPLARLW